MVTDVLWWIDIQHVAEIPFENEWVTKTREVDHGTVTHLENIGVLGENLLAAHSVWVSSSEVFIKLILSNTEEPHKVEALNFIIMCSTN